MEVGRAIVVANASPAVGSQVKHWKASRQGQILVLQSKTMYVEFQDSKFETILIDAFVPS